MRRAASTLDLPGLLRGTSLLVALLGAAASLAVDTRADDVRPLTLTVMETTRDTFDVRFQTPMRGNARLRVSPRLPDLAVVVSDSFARRKAGDSLIERFTFELEGGLVGHTLGISGLALGSRNAILTLRLLDGRILRAVLGGTRPSYTVEPLPLAQQSHWTDDVGAVAREGLVHGLTRPAHLLLAIALVLACVGSTAPITWLLALGAFLVMTVLGGLVGPVERLTVEVAEALMALVAALAVREALLGRQRHLVFLTLVAGLAHGLSEHLVVPDGGGSPSFLMHLGSALGLDLAHLLVAGLTLLVFSRLRAPLLTRGAAWILGVLACAFAFGFATEPDAAAATMPSAALPMPIALEEGAGPGAPTPTAPGLVTDVETYLDVGVFETRVETLGRLGAFERWLGLERGAGETIEVAAQGDLLGRVATALQERLTVTIDGRAALPDLTRKGFAIQEATGTYLRDVPAPEPAAAALVGVTFAFRTPTIPNDVRVAWSSFPTGLSEMRARVIDPEISREAVVLPEASVLGWTNELAEDPLPPVSAIQVRPAPVPFPVLSFLLALAALLGSATLFGRAWRPAANVAFRVGLALAFLATPLLTVDVSAWFPSRAAPTPGETRAITQALLDNVYRAFNVRDESAVYDRLALSLADETREAAYLENRRALAFERVGGARTHVDAVELIDLEDVKPTDDGGFEATTRWTVAGSVTHFGHRHLRQNAYRARLRVVPVEGAWQIRTFDIEDLQRTR